MSAYLGGEKFHLEGQGLCGALVPWYGGVRVVNRSEDRCCRYFLGFGVVTAVGGEDER